MRLFRLLAAPLVGAISFILPSDCGAVPPPPVPPYWYGCLTVGPYTTPMSGNWWRAVMISPKIDNSTIFTLRTFPTLATCETAAAQSNLRDEHDWKLPVVPWGWHQ